MTFASTRIDDVAGREEPLVATLPGPQTIRGAVRGGLGGRPRRLPPWLFYDRQGSELFEAITELPEYYLTRAERAIFEAQGATLMDFAAEGAHATVIELGAGTAAKTQVLVRELARRQGATMFVPIDLSPTALETARARFGAEEPEVRVRPWVATHEEAFARLGRIEGRKVVLFVGSSLGNYEGEEALRWLADLRAGLTEGDALVLGTDLRKDPAILLDAYDDGAGVTAAFNRNVLARINRELDGHFVPERFRHVALWNESCSRIEMHLESDRDQVVRIDDLGMMLRLARGERIHTESSVKYDGPMVDHLLSSAGFSREHTFTDDRGYFAVHLARASGLP